MYLKKNCSTSYHVIILYHINTCHFFGTFFASDQLYWLNPQSFSLQPFIFFFPYDCLHPILSSSSCPLSLQQQHLEQLSIWPNNEGKDKYFVENRLLDCYIYIYITYTFLFDIGQRKSMRSHPSQLIGFGDPTEVQKGCGISLPWFQGLVGVVEKQQGCWVELSNKGEEKIRWKQRAEGRGEERGQRSRWWW